MARLIVNGITVPCAVRDPQRKVRLIADKDFAFDGTPRRVVRAIPAPSIGKRTWELSLIPEPAGTVDAAANGVTAWHFEQLLNGQGQVWSFNTDLGSSRGLYNATGTGSIEAGGKYGNRVRLTGATSWAVGTGVYTSINSTILVWKLSGDGTTWEHWILRGSGTKWLNGVTTVLPSTWLGSPVGGTLTMQAVAPSAWVTGTVYALNALVRPTVANGRYYRATTGGTSGGVQPTWPTTFGNTVNDGSVVWTDQGVTDTIIDDMVILPFNIPDSWASLLFTEMSGRAFSQLPRVRADGDLIRRTADDTPGVTCIGEFIDAQLLPVQASGFGRAVYQQSPFVLWEC
jgi:hypothetical protein